MAAELGQTNDPKALIPGDPATVQDMIAALNRYGNELHAAGAGLRRIDTGDGWSGAAADGFHNVFHGQPGTWLQAGDCFHQASQALDRYATALTCAQGQAGDAIRQWNQAQAATAEAQEQHTRAVQQAQQQAQQKTATGIPTVAPDIPFTDPGTASRQAAQDLLARARGQLTSAGNTAADLIGRARDQAPPKPSLLDQIGNALGDGLNTVEQAASSTAHFVENMGAHAINDLASLGNAAVHHPGDVLGMLGGGLLTTVSAAGEGLGGVLDVTGAGAVIGVPLNGVSAVGIATGVGIAGASAANMAMHAAGDDHVEPLKTGNQTASGTGNSEPPFPAPKETAGFSDHAKQQIAGRDGGHGVNDAAIQDAVSNPVKPPQYRPDQYGGSYRYTGKDAVINLNKDGQVTTAWAKSRAGWRNP